MGENIAKGYRSPAAVVRGWMHSKGHRANILSPKFTHLCVGVCRGYWVQTFGGGRPKIVRRFLFGCVAIRRGLLYTIRV